MGYSGVVFSFMQGYGSVHIACLVEGYIGIYIASLMGCCGAPIQPVLWRSVEASFSQPYGMLRRRLCGQVYLAGKRRLILSRMEEYAGVYITSVVALYRGVYIMTGMITLHLASILAGRYTA
jgi:hypothetical protein